MSHEFLTALDITGIANTVEDAQKVTAILNKSNMLLVSLLRGVCPGCKGKPFEDDPDHVELMGYASMCAIVQDALRLAVQFENARRSAGK